MSINLVYQLLIFLTKAQTKSRTAQIVYLCCEKKYTKKENIWLNV